MIAKSYKYFISFFILILVIFAVNVSASAETINVRDLGAKGDGKTDDTQIIQSAINSANGKIVYLPIGTYGISKTITIPSNTEILGDNGTSIVAIKSLSEKGFTFTFQGKQYTNFLLIFAHNAENIKVSNIRVNANRAVQTTNRNVSAILFSNVSNSQFTNVIALNNKAADGASLAGGVFNIFNSSNIYLQNCGIVNADVEGLLIRQSTNVTVKGGEYMNSTSSVIGTQWGSGIIIDGVKAHDSANSTISLNSIKSKVINSQVYNSKRFYAINLGHRTTVSTAKPADDSVVEGNTVYGAYFGGINIQYGSRIKIANNTVYNNRGAYDAGVISSAYGGINATTYADELEIVGNNVYNNNRGIYLAFNRKITDGKYNLGKSDIYNNNIYKNLLSGIQIKDAVLDTNIYGNRLYDNNLENHVARGEISINYLVLNNYKYETGESGLSVHDNQIGSDLKRKNGIYIYASRSYDQLTYKAVISNNIIKNMQVNIAFDSLSREILQDVIVK